MLACVGVGSRAIRTTPTPVRLFYEKLISGSFKTCSNKLCSSVCNSGLPDNVFTTNFCDKIESSGVDY